MSWTAPHSVEGGVAGQLVCYDRGLTPYFASRTDPRFSYCLYVPQDVETGEALDLVVLVHGTARWAEHCRSAFADFCEKNRTILLAPLFPAGVAEPGELSSYKLANRLEWMAALRASLETHGVSVVQDIVPGAGHDGRAMLEPVQRWMVAMLGAARGSHEARTP